MSEETARQTIDAMWDYGLTTDAFPDCFGKFTGRLLVCGAARCLWDDLEPWIWNMGRGLVRFDGDVMCVNEVGVHFPGVIRHWYSNDPKLLRHWSAVRRSELIAEVDKQLATRPYELHSYKDGVKYRWPWPGHCNSGLIAVYTGLGLGYEEIILAGLPNDDSGHYFDPPWRKTNFTKEGDPERRWAMARDKFFFGRVKSLSGWTAEILGKAA